MIKSFVFDTNALISAHLLKKSVSRLAYDLTLEMRSYLIRVTKEFKICSDPDDDKFLNLAVSAKASYIIRGDKALVEIKSFENIPILNASEFLKLD